MHIGITFDLRSEYLAAGFSELETAEFDSAETIDALEWALTTLGHQVDRIGHARQLVTRLARGDRWDGVFNICEGLHGLGREAQVPAILDAFQIPYTFSDTLVMALSLHKGHTKSILQQVGIPTPAFHVAKDASDLKSVCVRYPAFVKPVGEGTGKGVSPRSRVESDEMLAEIAPHLLQDHRQPVLIEEYLPGREFTVGLVGTGEEARVLGTLEIILKSQADPGVYSYRNKEQCEELVEYRLVHSSEDLEVQQAEQIALRAWRILGCCDGGRVDLRSDSLGRPQFLEVNPLAGLHPTHSDLPMLATAVGMDYVTLIGQILESACTRWMSHENSHSAQSRG